MSKITLLGAGLIGSFYAESLCKHRSRDRIHAVYSRSQERADRLAKQWRIPKATTDLQDAIRDDQSDVVVVALPNHLHEEAVCMAAEAGKPPPSVSVTGIGPSSEIVETFERLEVDRLILRVPPSPLDDVLRELDQHVSTVEAVGGKLDA